MNEMRILHTSDWHIGKKTENKDRLDDQSAVIDEIIGICDAEKVDLAIIAGDIFDTFVPYSEAEELFFDKISTLSGRCGVLIIPGNHDDPVRLAASAPFASSKNVYLMQNSSFVVNKNVSPVGVAVTDWGKNYICFKSTDGQEVYIGALPYPTEARLKEKSSGEDYADRVEVWMKECFSNNVKALPQILVTHLFAMGGVTSDSEREISLGGARIIDKSRFPDAIYTALGHLHKRQVIDSKRNIIYSGSILQYSFDEVNVDKSVTIFDVMNNELTNLHHVILTKGKRLARLSFDSFESAMVYLPRYCDSLVELTLKLKNPLNREETSILSTNYPNVVSLKIELQGNRENVVRGRRNLSDENLFKACYLKENGSEPSEDVVKLFLELICEVEEK